MPGLRLACQYSCSRPPRSGSSAVKQAPHCRVRLTQACTTSMNAARPSARAAAAAAGKGRRGVSIEY